MKLSANQELIQKLKQILENCPGLEYDEHSSACMDNVLMVKVSTKIGCDISTAGDIARKLSESTGDQYKVQPSSGSGGSSLNNLKGFGLFLLAPNRNVRITYPDSKNGKLEVDVVEGVEMSLNVDDPQLWNFAEGNDLEIRINIFAQPNYRKFLRSHVTRITRNYKELPGNSHQSNSEFKKLTNNAANLSK